MPSGTGHITRRLREKGWQLAGMAAVLVGVTIFLTIQDQPLRNVGILVVLCGVVLATRGRMIAPMAITAVLGVLVFTGLVLLLVFGMSETSFWILSVLAGATVFVLAYRWASRRRAEKPNEGKARR